MYSFCPEKCGSSSGNSTNTKWSEILGKIYRNSDVSIGANTFPSKLYVDGNISGTGDFTIGNNYFLGNINLAQGLPVDEPSKWGESGGNLFRNSLVSINQGSVNTNYDFFVNGNTNILTQTETSNVNVSGNIDMESLNVSDIVIGNFYHGDAGGMSNVGSGGLGSRWNENLDGNIFVLKNVGIRTSDPYERLTINGNVIIDNNLIVKNNSEITNLNGSIYINPSGANELSTSLQVGGQVGNLISGNFLSENRLHTTLNSYLSHCSIVGEENIKFAVLAIRGVGDFDVIINTIDVNFEVQFDDPSQAFVIRSTIIPKPLANGKRVSVMTQTNNQAGFAYANVVESSPLLTAVEQIFFKVQTGEFSGFGLFKKMSPAPKEFFCLIMLNDF
jgi:hypothetical protein